MPTYLIAFNDEWVPPHSAAQLEAKSAAAAAVTAEMERAGVYVFGDGGLDRSCIIANVTAVDGRAIVTDGPYAETKEHLGGFCVITVADDDAAKYWAGRLATALDWPQEIHRFPTFEQIQAAHAADD